MSSETTKPQGYVHSWLRQNVPTNFEVKSFGEKSLQIEVECVFCKKKHILTLQHSGLAKWQMGHMLQDAMPDLSPVQRELLISGSCDCWTRE